MKRLIVLLATLLLSFGLSYGANNVNVTMTAPGGSDTIRTTLDFTFDIYLENDFKLFGLSMGWIIWSPDGATWTWRNAGGYGPSGVVTTFNDFTDADAVLDMSGFLVVENDLNQVTPDKIGFGGAANRVGLPVGALRKNFALNLTCGTVEGATICIDSVFIPPATAFIFTNELGSNTVPTRLWATPLCYPTAIMPNFCPEFNAGNQGTMTVNHCGQQSVIWGATDFEQDAIAFNLVGSTGAGTATVQDLANGTCRITYTPVAGDVGSAVVITVGAGDAYNGPACATADLNVTVTNNVPTISCGAVENFVGKGNLIIKTDIVGHDNDGCDNLTYAMVGVTPKGDIDPSTGVWSWQTEIGDVGDYVVCVSVTDGIADPVECCFNVHVLAVEPFEIVIEKLHDVYQGHFVDLPIWLTKGSEAMGGFDFLLAYDPTLLTFTEASLGDYFVQCGWEYFTYRFGYHGNCGNGCPSGEIRVVGMAETNNGPIHPDFECITAGVDQILVNLTFFVTTDVNANGQYAAVKFFWMDCGDNAISVMTGDTLAISRFVYNYYGTDGMDSYIDVTDNDWGFPGVYGAPNFCLTQTEKGRPIRFIDFFNGGIDIINKDDIDARGDINMNGLANEIADAVMFTNYFITGLSAFGAHVDGSIAASDVNADGTALTVADLVYLVRIIIGDALPYPKPAPGSMFEVSTQLKGGVLNVGVETTVDAGAALFVFNVNGEAGDPVVHNNMDVASSFNNGELRVLVYNIGSEAISSGQLLSIPVNGSAELISVEAADYNGSMMESTFRALPSSFAVHQNYPNPFNPTTMLSFDLSVASQWTIDLYNIAGQKVNSFNGFDAPGTVQITWDGTDFSGKAVASGIYFYKVTAGTESSTKKMVLTK